MVLPEGFTEELKARNRLEDVVAQYVTLKRAGSNFVACCPFHSERTPSFTVFPQTESFYCFGCGAGGDVITFVMKTENLDYMAAVEKLAERAGIPMPSVSGDKKTTDRKRFFAMNAAAAKFFFDTLVSPAGKRGLDYLLSRGLSMSAIRRFGLGYAPDSFDALSRHLLSHGYTQSEIKEGFLGGIGKNGKLFDYFRNRAMFPIIDVSGNVVAFSGRFVGTPGENDRKYFNTNDTPVFKKSRTVFALNIAKNNPEKTLVLCEGNMDAVSLHAGGIPNAVASLGTALTSEQSRLMARYAETVYICYDSDEAGRRATRKAIRLLTDAGLKVMVMTLGDPECKDPDDFIRKRGKEAFLERERAAKGYVMFLFDEIAEKHDLSSMDGKNAFIKEMTAMLSEVYSPVERELYIVKTAELTGVAPALIRAETDKSTEKTQRSAEKEAIKEEMRHSRGFGDKVNPDKAKFLSSAVKEESVIGILLLRKEYLNDKKIREALDPKIFSCGFHRKVVEKLLDITKNGEEPEISLLNSDLTPEEMGSLERMKQKRSGYSNNSPDVIFELTERLREGSEKASESEKISAEWLEDLKKKKTRK